VEGFDLNDLANLAAIRQREEQQRLLREQNEKLEEIQRGKKRGSKRTPCPVCGESLDGEYRKCKNCLSDLVWISGNACEPGQEEALKARLKKESTKARRKRRRKRKQQEQNKLSRADRITILENSPQTPEQKKNEQVLVGLLVGLGVVVLFFVALECSGLGF